MAILVKHSGATNHGKGAVAQFKLDVNDVTYHTLLLDVTKAGAVATVAQIKAAIEKVEVKLNGKTQQEWDINDLLAHNGYNLNEEDEAGKIEVHFRDITKQTINGQDSTSYGMLGQANFIFEVTYKDATEAVDVECEMHYLKGKGTNLGLHTTVTPIKGFSCAVGKKTIRELNTGDGVLRALMIDSDAIDNVLLKVGTVVLHESTKKVRQRTQKLNGRKPITGYTFIDLDLEKRLVNGIPRDKDFVLELTATSALDSFKIIEIVDTPEEVKS